MTLRRTYSKPKLQLAKGVETLKYIKGNNQHNKVHNSNASNTQREYTHTKALRVRVFWCFFALEFDLSVRVQTTARAPFVSLFSGDSIGGKARRDGGILGRKIFVDARRRFRSTDGNNTFQA